MIIEGSFKKYILYAIGEIALVVIGILIALQINNWNESKKERKTEYQLLLELEENLELNIQQLKEGIDRKNKSDFSSQVIQNAMEKDLAYSDTLTKHFGWGLSLEDPGPLSKAGYESFKNTGTNILQNKELKKEIIYLFEDSYALSATRLDRVMEYNVELNNLRQQYLMRLENFNFEPFDYNQLIRDRKFESWLKSIRNSRTWVRNAMERSLSESERVLHLLQQELDK